jgi:hypothetical protein
MKYWLVPIGLSLIAFPTLHRGPPDAADFARRAQHLVGHKNGPLVIDSVTAQDNVLVITVDGPENWRGGYSSYMLTAPFLDGFCRSSEAKGYFEDGRRLRVDTVEAGRRPIQGGPVSRCRT